MQWTSISLYDGFSVIERARPRASEMSLGVNHSGVAVVAAAGVRLSAVDVGLQPTTFEYVAARVTSSSSPQSVVVVVVYRPGSSTVTATFFSELTDLLDRLSTYRCEGVLNKSDLKNSWSCLKSRYLAGTIVNGNSTFLYRCVVRKDLC